MKRRLAIVTDDKGYAEHLSGYLSERFAENFEVAVFSKAERFEEALKSAPFDVALLDIGFELIEVKNTVRVPLVLAQEGKQVAEEAQNIKQIRKYQRISLMVGDILEALSKIPHAAGGISIESGNITVVWSPSGGTGKTSVALAYAMNRAAMHKRAVYLNLENFASTPAYFRTDGKSISKAFESLDSEESNLRLLMVGLRQQDTSTGIYYFSEPENYDDMNILSPDNIEALVFACAAEADELVVDLSSQYNSCTRRLFELANSVFIVTDSSLAAQVKLKQFIGQHSAFEQIRLNAKLVCNKGAHVSEAEISKTVYLNRVQSSEPKTVVKTLAGYKFE